MTAGRPRKRNQPPKAIKKSAGKKKPARRKPAKKKTPASVTARQPGRPPKLQACQFCDGTGWPKKQDDRVDRRRPSPVANTTAIEEDERCFNCDGTGSKLTKDICMILRGGSYIETAMEFHGLVRDTYYKWADRGREEDERLEENPASRVKKSELLYLQFFYAVKKAAAHAEVRDLSVISQAAARGIWQAAAWRRERKDPDKWGRRERSKPAPPTARPAVEALFDVMAKNVADRQSDTG